MEAIRQHLMEFWAYYALGGAVLLPLIWFTRQWSFGIIQWCVEIAIYFGLLHAFLHGFVWLLRGFKKETQMKQIVDEIVDPEWGTPLYEFWERELYTPQWIFWVELTALVMICILVFMYRPMRTQRRVSKMQARAKGKVPQEGSYANYLKGKRKGNR